MKDRRSSVRIFDSVGSVTLDPRCVPPLNPEQCCQLVNIDILQFIDSEKAYGFVIGFIGDD